MSENEPVKKDLQLLHSPDFYSFLILLLILELFSIYMLLFSDSYNETVFWLCVLFISLTYSLLTTIFFVCTFQFSCTLSLFTLNTHQKQELIRLVFIWTLDPIQKDLGSQTDKFILDKPSKSLENPVEAILKIRVFANRGLQLSKILLPRGGSTKMRNDDEKKPQFNKDTSMERVLEQCHKVKKISMGRNLRL